MNGPDVSGPTTPPEPDEDDMDFRAIVDEVLAGYFRSYPVRPPRSVSTPTTANGRT